jgi:hypothetical protein
MSGTPIPKFEGQKIEGPKPSQDQGTKQASLTSVTSPSPAEAVNLVNLTEPARLKGLTPVQVSAVLGQPSFQRHDAPAEIWQYRGHTCTLDLYIYDAGNGKSVEHWAVRSPARVADGECFQQLVDQGHSHPGS